MTARMRRPYIVVQEAQQDKLIDSLRACGSPHAFHLADKLTRCRASREKLRAWGGRPDLRALLSEKGRYRCEHHACWSCRRKRTADFAKKEAPRFGDADNRFCSHVTIADAVTGDLGVVRQRVTAMTRGFRDRRDAAAAGRAPWCAVEAVGHVELDPYLPEDIENYFPDQQALIPSLPVLARADDGGPMWVVRAHLAVRHDGIGRGELEEVLKRQWPGAGRVHVAPFHEDQPAQENAGTVICYGTKHEHQHDVGDMSERWPVSWQAQYWAWLHEMKRGLQPLRISVGPRRPKPDAALPILRAVNSSASISSSASPLYAGRRGDTEEQPMPVAFGIGVPDLGVLPPLLIEGVGDELVMPDRAPGRWFTAAGPPAGR